jgi:hypothetical protein
MKRPRLGKSALERWALRSPRRPCGAGRPSAAPSARATPGRSIASNDQSSATSTNPANLGYLVSSEARWTWVKTGEGSPVPGRGHAFDLAISLPANIGTGFRLDFVRPNYVAFPLDSRTVFPTAPTSPRHYTWFTWGVGVAPTPVMGIVFSVAHAGSENPTLDGLTSLSAAVSARPSPYLGLSVVGRDLNRPTAPLHTQDRSVDIAIALVRPAGAISSSAWRILHERLRTLAPRATIGIDIPTSAACVARSRRPNPSADPSRTATAGLELGVGSEARGRVSSSGGGGGRRWFLWALRSSDAAGIPESSYAQDRIHGNSSARRHVQLLRHLWRIAKDRDQGRRVHDEAEPPTPSPARNSATR